MCGWIKEKSKNKKEEEMNYGHGDLIIRSVPSGVISMGKMGGEPWKKLGHLILAYGEVTSHKHEIVEGDAELYEKDGTLYLVVKSEEAKLAHPEHATIAIPKGTYKVDHQREHVPGENVERERQVWD